MAHHGAEASESLIRLEGSAGFIDRCLVPLVVANRYTIVRPIGTGGMGTVYEATDSVLAKRVALKILHPNDHDHDYVHARFLQEARAASAIDHPNVVKCLDFGTHAGGPFIVMEFLRGESFAEVLADEGPLSAPRALSLLDPVARALDRVHRMGIIHRDIKPENVFLADAELPGLCVPKLLDFGIAKRLYTADPMLTNGAVALGTPFYMPPEQVLDARQVSAAADQYAFAVMLYEAVAGCGPHDGKSYNELIIQKATLDPRPLSESSPSVPRGFAEALLRGLARDPAARYPSMEAFRQALAEGLGGELPPPARSRARREAAADEPATQVDAAVARDDLAAPEAPRARRSPASPAWTPRQAVGSARDVLTVDERTMELSGDATAEASSDGDSPPVTASPPSARARPHRLRWTAFAVALLALGLIAAGMTRSDGGAARASAMRRPEMRARAPQRPDGLPGAEATSPDAATGTAAVTTDGAATADTGGETAEADDSATAARPTRAPRAHGAHGHSHASHRHPYAVPLSRPSGVPSPELETNPYLRN